MTACTSPPLPPVQPALKPFSGVNQANQIQDDANILTASALTDTEHMADQRSLRILLVIEATATGVARHVHELAHRLSTAATRRTCGTARHA